MVAAGPASVRIKEREEFQLVLSTFAIERLLYRLGLSPLAERFVLKGATLLRLWSQGDHRATWDLDLLGRGASSVAEVAEDLCALCEIEADDGIVFDAASVQLSNVDKKAAEGEIPVRICNYVDVYYNDRITSELEFMKATATPEQVRRFSLRRGDVLITKDSETWDDIAVPAVVEVDLPEALCGYHLAHIRPGRECDGRFLGRLFSAIGLREQFHVAANGITRFGFGGDVIRTGEFPLPSLAEQRAIAAFLDRETATIDGLVARKERLCELLQEKRAVLITRAITRGLDPNAPP